MTCVLDPWVLHDDCNPFRGLKSYMYDKIKLPFLMFRPSLNGCAFNESEYCVWINQNYSEFVLYMELTTGIWPISLGRNSRLPGCIPDDCFNCWSKANVPLHIWMTIGNTRVTCPQAEVCGSLGNRYCWNARMTIHLHSEVWEWTSSPSPQWQVYSHMQTFSVSC